MVVSVEELEEQVEELRHRPLLVLCRTPNGRERLMTVQECVSTGSVFIHVVVDELDALLASELGESKVHQK